MIKLAMSIISWILFVTILGCSRRSTSVQNTYTSPVSPCTFLKETTFEDSKSLYSWKKEFLSPKSVFITDLIARKGRLSARFELNNTDSILLNGIRSEITLSPETEDERWYAASNFFPESYYADPQPEIVLQWHSVPDLPNTPISPPISLLIQDDRFKVGIQWASKHGATNQTVDGKKLIDLGPVDKGVWIDWVFHIKYSYKSDGILQVFKNKVKVIDYRGPNSYNDTRYPYFKVGIYKWPWMTADGRAKSSVSHRVLFYDEIRVSDKNCSLEGISPN